MTEWSTAALAKSIVTLAYLSISLHILRGVDAGRSWRTNPLAVATGLLFLSCAAGSPRWSASSSGRWRPTSRTSWLGPRPRSTEWTGP